MKDRDNSGALFKNDRREKDTDPLYRGSATLDGQEYWVNAWVNHDKNGKPYMKLAFKRKES